jgi:hypothetical protein
MALAKLAALGVVSSKLLFPGLIKADEKIGIDTHRWFSIPLEIHGLPRGPGFVPASVTIDLSDALRQLNLTGVVDERTLRLHQITADGQMVEVPVQFMAAPQPRPKKRSLLEGTAGSVSYLAEYAAGVTPESLAVAGELAWIARPNSNGQAQYQLICGVPRTGRSIQVPFPPQNLRSFDEAGRATPVRWFPVMQFRPQWPLNGVIQVFDRNQLVTAYHVGPTVEQIQNPAFRRPFLYPLNGPDGVSLTEFGKPQDPTGSHAHHYSLWIAHDSVNGKDFWSEKGGVIAHEQLAHLEDGPVYCRLTQKTRWMSGHTALLRETRQFTFYKSAPEFRLIDIDLRFNTATAEPVVFGKTSFGFLAARVAQSMTVFDGGGEILNASGNRNEQRAHLQRARWIDQSGPIAEGKWNGLAIFDHPQNVNHPTGWHCRNDGWAGAAFNMDNDYILEPGDTLHLRYRINLHRHDAVRSGVEQRYSEYAAQPVVRVGKPNLTRK